MSAARSDRVLLPENIMVEHGLFDKPTVLNNVETYANVPGLFSVPMLVNQSAPRLRIDGTLA